MHAYVCLFGSVCACLYVCQCISLWESMNAYMWSLHVGMWLCVICCATLCKAETDSHFTVSQTVLLPRVASYYWGWTVIIPWLHPVKLRQTLGSVSAKLSHRWGWTMYITEAEQCTSLRRNSVHHWIWTVYITEAELCTSLRLNNVHHWGWTVYITEAELCKLLRLNSVCYWGSVH